jgi:hypothetical protein
VSLPIVRYKVIIFLLWLTVCGIEKLTAFRFIDCSSCHVKISEEWGSSLHAQGYTSPVFLKKKESPEYSGNTSCSCHAPRNLPQKFLGVDPELRSDSLESGVDCIACHMDNDLVAYSSGKELTVPHWVKKNDIYARGLFCTGCHRWGKNVELDCQDCHMPETAGAAADGPHFAPAQGASHLSHRWAGSRDPEKLAEGASLEARRNGESLVVKVTNEVGAHSFPVSGNRGAKVVIFTGDAGRPLFEEPVRLAPDSAAEYSVRLPDNNTQTRIELRFYPAPAVWPDSFYALVRRLVK